MTLGSMHALTYLSTMHRMLNPAGFLLWGLKPGTTNVQMYFSTTGFFTDGKNHWVFARGHWVLHFIRIHVYMCTYTYSNSSLSIDFGSTSTNESYIIMAG